MTWLGVWRATRLRLGCVWRRGRCLPAVADESFWSHSVIVLCECEHCSPALRLACLSCASRFVTFVCA